VGAGNRGLQASTEPLDCGNSASTMRMLAGMLVGQNFDSILTGDESLRSRPMKRIIEPLEMMGAQILSDGGNPPLIIKANTSLEAIRYNLPVASAQVKSAVLVAGLRARGRTEVIETLGITRDHTERMLNWFGAPVETRVCPNGLRTITIDGPATFDGSDIEIPGDISSAAFLVAAAALIPGSELEISGIGLNPTRTQFLLTFRSLGLEIDMALLNEKCGEPVGSIRISGHPNPEPAQPGKSNLLRGALISQLIDELPLLGVVGTQVPGGIEIRDASELRFKETDRISATVKNLRTMGAEVVEFEDGLAVAGMAQLRGAKLDAVADHRIAMAFTIAALLADGESEITGAENVEVSFPEFFGLLESVVQR
jgi:3-phosphoshikimate 1-carboxyvinyltransferase